MNKEDTKEAIEIMQAFVDGKTIESRYRGYKTAALRPFVLCPNPTWDFLNFEYRIKASVPDSIDWSHVNKKFNFMARDSKGKAFLYENMPTLGKTMWYELQRPVPAELFSSYKQGDVPWDESLVERPKTEPYVVETVLGYD